MTLKQLIGYIEYVASTQPNVNITGEGDVYRLMNDPKSEKYTSVVISQLQHTFKDDFTCYNFNIFYIDRLLDDLESNRLSIQSTAIETLKNIVRTVTDELGVDIPTLKFQTFTEKFNSLAAGAYVQLRLELPDDYICPEYYE